MTYEQATVLSEFLTVTLPQNKNKVNHKRMDRYRRLLTPSVHKAIIDHTTFINHTELVKVHYQHVINNMGRKPWGLKLAVKNYYTFYIEINFSFTLSRVNFKNAVIELYIDAMTCPNLPFKVLSKFNNEKVNGICRKMRDDRSYSEMSILADALEDQDFPDMEYLSHLRNYPQFSKANFCLQFFLNQRICYTNKKKWRLVERPRLFPFQQEIIDRIRNDRLRFPTATTGKSSPDLQMMFVAQPQHLIYYPVEGVTEYIKNLMEDKRDSLLSQVVADQVKDIPVSSDSGMAQQFHILNSWSPANVPPTTFQIQSVEVQKDDPKNKPDESGG